MTHVLVQADNGNAERAPFDVIRARVTTENDVAVFHMAVAGQAGETRSTPTGSPANSEVFAYVWPTSLDSAEVGLVSGAGILALAVSAHPAFDDTPSFDVASGDLGQPGEVSKKRARELATETDPPPALSSVEASCVEVERHTALLDCVLRSDYPHLRSAA